VTDVSNAGQLLPLTGIDWNEAAQLAFLEEVLAPVGDQLVPLVLSETFRNNPHCSIADAAVIYGLVNRYEPTRLMEIGCGFSTLAFRFALNARRLPGELIAVDPNPTTDITEYVDAHLPARVQDVPVSDFEILQAGELLFIDSTHRYRAEDGVPYLFEEVIPKLNCGVYLGFHGVRLPREYTAEELRAGHDEQQRIATLLKSGRVEVLFAGAWLTENHAAALNKALPAAAKGGAATALWLRVR